MAAEISQGNETIGTSECGRDRGREGTEDWRRRPHRERGTEGARGPAAAGGGSSLPVSLFPEAAGPTVVTHERRIPPADSYVHLGVDGFA